jgi:hypothetical protein
MPAPKIKCVDVKHREAKPSGAVDSLAVSLAVLAKRSFGPGIRILIETVK